MDNLYIQHCQELRELYQKNVNYRINNDLQELDYNVDIDQLRKEIFSIITKNDYGYDTVSLRMPIDNTNWVDQKENVTTGGINPIYYDIRKPEMRDDFNFRPNIDYTEWHPDINKDSYIIKLINEIENFVGLKIGRVRLAWQPPNYGYTLHSDHEPMRLHIPIITNKDAWFINDKKIYHMDYGKLYHLITTGPHTATNYGALPRLHLILSTYVSEEITKKIFELKDPVKSIDNFKDTINQQGVDQNSLAVLLKLEKTQKLIGQDDIVLINKIIKEK